jgi:hypothetical protein
MATEAKTLLWQGVSQAKVALLVGISQATVSRLKDGRSNPDTSWPNGMTGAMPDRTMSREEGWSDEASEFMKMPEVMQNRILEMVNEVREEQGDALIPHTAPEYEKMLRMDVTDRLFEQIDIAEARLAEDRRMSALMIQFNEIMDSRRAEHDDEAINRIIKSTLSQRDDSSTSPPALSSDVPEGRVLTYNKMPWEEVCYKAYKVRIVKLAMIGERVALKEACCIVLHALRGSRTSWNDEAVADQIHEMADKLERHQDIMDRLVVEYEGV